MQQTDRQVLGARPQAGGVQFSVWAPEAGAVELLLGEEADAAPMEAGDGGVFERFVPDLRPGARYRYRLDGGDPLPDPVSRFQPEGVHGPSEVVDPAAYDWQDGAWEGVPQENLIFYELHVGTFTPEGTFAAAEERLPYLKELGVTAVELMPVAAFPGRWNWGYDPAAFYAPSSAYGRPRDLRAFVDAAHAQGLAVFHDVVYNHFGPDGAYAAAFAPFFTEKHHTPWGKAVNLDDAHSAGVRRFFIENALLWLREYHVDGLRLDATFALVDDSETHFLKELAAEVAALEQGPRRLLIAEDNRNERHLLETPDEGGYGLDGVWADDFHHQMRNLLAGNTAGYYRDYAGTEASDVAETLRQGWFFTGQYAEHFEEPRGTDPAGLPLDRFVVCIQNHDQVGNRPHGDRLHHEIALPAYRAASALLLFAPELPLLFMGQEWAASTPFQYFTDHHEELGRLVSEGRKREFDAFIQSEVPDPQDAQTFTRSKLDWNEHVGGDHSRTLALYQDLLALRKELGGDFEVQAHGARALTLRRGRHHLLVAFEKDIDLSLPEGAEILLHTEQPAYAEDGRPPHAENGQVRFAEVGAVVAAA